MLLNLEDLKQPPFYHEMILVEGGTFMMGSEGKDSYEDERPLHEVTVNSFQIAKYPVTQALWKWVMGDLPEELAFIDERGPVERVSWKEVEEGFIQQIREKTGVDYRLPTEAEWEFAARGGKHSKSYQYAGSNDLKEVGWYKDNSHQETIPVGLKHPNELGLYDMSGNVWELCSDWYSDEYYEECKASGLVEDPQGPKKGGNRVYRGGSRAYTARLCRPSCRSYWYAVNRNYYLGFRLALAPPPVR